MAEWAQKRGEIYRHAVLLLIAALMVVLASISAAAAKPVIADISEYRIAITSDFTGKQLLLFGARNDPGDIVIVVRGPERDVLVRKKEQIFGVWVNTQQARFDHVPYYYAVGGTRPLEELAPSSLYSHLNIGFDKLDMTPSKLMTKERLDEFREAYFDIQQQRGLFIAENEPLRFMGPTLFKTQISFPDTLPRGEYAVDIYLFEDGQLRGMQSLPIEVAKVGFDAFVYEMAHQHSLLYGLCAVFIALSVGWIVSVLFNKLW